MNIPIRKHKTYKSESDVKDDIKKVLTKHGVWYFMPSMNGYGRSGIPDFVCCVNGRFMAIEAKFGRGTTTAHQDRELNAIQHSMGITYVISELNIDTLDAFIKTIIELENNVSR